MSFWGWVKVVIAGIAGVYILIAFSFEALQAITRWVSFRKNPNWCLSDELCENRMNVREGCDGRECKYYDSEY